MSKIIIAIDGHSACGKSSTAKKVAEHLQYNYIDTGAMYRAVTYYFLKKNISFDNQNEIDDALKKINIHFQINPKTNIQEIFLNGKNIENEIRTMYITNKVSDVSKIKKVRESMVRLQQKMGEEKGVVLDGRDIGTVVFPNAELKFFLTATIQERGKRRRKEFLENNQLITLDDVIRNLEKRDLIDSTRSESPLVEADDTIKIDTTHLTFEQQVEKIVRLAEEITHSRKNILDNSNIH